MNQKALFQRKKKFPIKKQNITKHNLHNSYSENVFVLIFLWNINNFEHEYRKAKRIKCWYSILNDIVNWTTYIEISSMNCMSWITFNFFFHDTYFFLPNIMDLKSLSLWKIQLEKKVCVIIKFMYRLHGILSDERRVFQQIFEE